MSEMMNEATQSPHQERLVETARDKNLADALFCAYPFRPGSRVLQVGSQGGAFASVLSRRCAQVTVLEPDCYQAHCARLRWSGLDNVKVWEETLEETEARGVRYDYVIYLVCAERDFLPHRCAYLELMGKLKSLLVPDGTLLLVAPNRLGLSALCGVPDPRTGRPFDGITENNSSFYRANGQQLLQMCGEVGFPHKQLYGIFPDWCCPQLIYSQDYLPGSEFRERIGRYFCADQRGRVLNERELGLQLLDHGVLQTFANSFLVEAGFSPGSQWKFAVASSTRSRERAFVTARYGKETVCKFPLFSQGRAGVEELLENTCALSARGVPVLPLQQRGDGVRMACVEWPTLIEHLNQCPVQGKEELLEYIEQLWRWILQSSPHISGEENRFLAHAPGAQWGPILQRAYLEMIPANCFYSPDGLVFFDQEFSLDCCPAGYVLCRIISDLHAFVPGTDQMIPSSFVAERYNLKSVWGILEKLVQQFHGELGQEESLTGISQWGALPRTQMERRRKGLTMGNQHKFDGSFNVTMGLEGQRVILFGSGRYADHFLNEWEHLHKPVFLVDNNPAVWGTQKRGYEIRNPSTLQGLMSGTFQVIITIRDYLPIVEQLEQMGIQADHYRIYDRSISSLLCHTLTDTMVDGKYHIGYVTGVFDLFHIGHLNLLKNCKNRCHYLIAGVLTDQLATQDKNKTPFIPFEERLEIVRQCRYVDRVYTIDFHNTDKVEAWKELRYGCLFSGGDHQEDPGWIGLQKQLRSLGSDLEFFPYTTTTSSTMLQRALSTYNPSGTV